MPKLPVLRNVGVVPLATEEPEGHDPRLQGALERLGERFPAIVRASKRFRVVDDDLVKDLWRSPSGRAELKDAFEVDALVGLTAAPMSDVVQLTARLMDPQLGTLLMEQDRVPRDWLLAADGSNVEDRVERLVFALFNRIPVDVSVTSVQGQYVTISGGSEQGVLPGDRVELRRVSVRALHPANGTWLEFDAKRLGTAEVIEVKTHNAVARLVGLAYDDAVQVGDGARIAAIRSRHKFARVADASRFQDGGSQGSVVVPPVYLGRPPAPERAPAPRGPLPKAGDKEGPRVTQQDGEEPPPDASAQSSDAPSEERQPAPASHHTHHDDDDDGGSILDKLKSPHDKWLDDLVVHFGAHWWSVKRPVSDSGQFPLWLVNSVGASVTRSLIEKIKVGFGGGVLFGQASAGGFVGYDSHAKIYWEDALAPEGFLTTWRAGGYGSFSGISVSKGKYGGGDWLRGGGFLGLGGQIHAAEKRYDWFGDAALMPLNIGRYGYSGKQYIVESAFGWRLGLGAYQQARAGEVQWGGALEISNDVLTLENGRRPTMADYRLKALARYAF